MSAWLRVQNRNSEPGDAIHKLEFVADAAVQIAKGLASTGGRGCDNQHSTGPEIRRQADAQYCVRFAKDIWNELCQMHEKDTKVLNNAYDMKDDEIRQLKAHLEFLRCAIAKVAGAKGMDESMCTLADQMNESRRRMAFRDAEPLREMLP